MDSQVKLAKLKARLAHLDQRVALGDRILGFPQAIKRLLEGGNRFAELSAPPAYRAQAEESRAFGAVVPELARQGECLLQCLLRFVETAELCQRDAEVQLNDGLRWRVAHLTKVDKSLTQAVDRVLRAPRHQVGAAETVENLLLGISVGQQPRAGKRVLVGNDPVAQMAAEVEQVEQGGWQFPCDLVLAVPGCLSYGGDQVGVLGVEPGQCAGVAGECQRSSAWLGRAWRDVGAAGVDQAAGGGSGVQVPAE